MLTLFTTAKPFKGHNAIIQRNALKSWKFLHPSVEIIVFGNDEGSAEVCEEFGLKHEAELARTEFGAIRLDDMFARAQTMASSDLLCYVNCDIILMDDFWRAFQRVRERGAFLLIGKRWDTDVADPLVFADPHWQRHLRNRARERGMRRRFEVDYLVFRKGLFREVLPLALGRLYWDHWLVGKARSLGAAVIDASRAVTAVHQNHDYSHHPQGRQGIWRGEDADRNLALVGSENPCSFESCTHLLTGGGMIIPTPGRKFAYEAPRFIARKISHLAFNLFVHKTFGIRKALGLRREGVRKLRP